MKNKGFFQQLAQKMVKTEKEAKNNGLTPYQEQLIIWEMIRSIH